MIHPTAHVDPSASIGEDAKIWNWVQVRERAKIGARCVLSKGVYVDFEVSIGDDCKIQNNVSLYHGVTLERGVFVGPHVCFTNDRYPRAINPDGTQKSAADWTVTPILVREGASIGANATILPGVTLGRFCTVGAGAVVTHDVPDHALVLGNPGRLAGSVCSCGKPAPGETRCAVCGY
jgi:UDP-2-acetamido-3-amino-2,3-dideoxy-glucuronate N-acetyltransferase